jgi:phosphomannomutase
MNKNNTLLNILQYEPVPSRFGTSGVRALVEDLTDLEVYCLVLGTLDYLETIDKVDRQGRPADTVKIPIAGDLRPSTERILTSAARAIMDAGYQVDYMGKLPTPALTYYALQQGVASFIVTGSHIPVDRNGIKANRSDGEVLKSDEQGIVAAVAGVRGSLYSQPATASKFAGDGMLKSAYRVALPTPNRAAEMQYIERYREVFSDSPLRGTKIIFFEYAAVGRDLLPRILEQAGAQLIRIGRSDEFVPIDTEAISDRHLQMFRELVVEQTALHGSIDALVSTDGDSDRPLMIAVVDNAAGEPVSLRFMPGDILGSIVADYLKSDAVAVPISVNPAVHEYFAAKGIITRKTRIGSPYVIEAIHLAYREGFENIAAWEANGGFLLGSDIKIKASELKALPTRDAILPMLCVFCSAAERNMTLRELLECFPRWFGRADLIDGFSGDASQRILAYFSPQDGRIKWQDFAQDRLVLRDLGENIVAEWAYDDPRAQKALDKKREMEALFTSTRGFAGISRLNTLDGIRCYFSDGEIAHIRPSGNAPQLRIYAYARSQSRADEIANMAVAEPDGILRTLESLIESKVPNECG